MLHDTPIEQVSSTSYLGIKIDNNIDFNGNITSVVLKSSRAVGALKKISQYLPRATRITMYNTLVLPHIDYCATIWGVLDPLKFKSFRKTKHPEVCA